jgi:predicted Zn finger-like uncharacterized protein
MPISLTCPKCKGNLRVNDHLAGKKIKCPKCAAVFPVAAPEEAAITADSPPRKIESIAAAPASDDSAEVETVPPSNIPRNVRRDPAAEAVSTIIPYKNGRALLAYYLGVFSFIPCVGLILGPAALILGILGIRFVRANPTAKGTGHAIAGIIMGSLTTLGYWGVVAVMVIMGGFVALTGGSSKTTVSPSPTTSGIPQQPRTPLFAGERDLSNPNGKVTLPVEPGRIAALRFADRINAMAFSPDGETLAIASSIAVERWPVAGGPSLSRQGTAQCLTFSPDGKYLAVARFGNPCKIELRNNATEAVERTLTIEGGQRPFPDMAMAFSSDGGLFAATSPSTFHLWETKTWTEKPHQFKAPNGRIRSLAFTPGGGGILAVGVGDSVLLWSTDAMTEYRSLKHPNGVRAVAFRPNSSQFASASGDGVIKLWDVEKPQEMRTLRGYAGPVRALCFSPDGRYLAEVDGMSAVRLWDVTGGRELATRRGVNQGNSVTALAFTPDGKTLLTTDAIHGIVKAWDVAALAAEKK